MKIIKFKYEENKEGITKEHKYKDNGRNSLILHVRQKKTIFCTKINKF